VTCSDENGSGGRWGSPADELQEGAKHRPKNAPRQLIPINASIF